MWLFAFLLAEGQAEGPPGWTSWMPLVLIGVMFYFLLLLPMQRQKKQLQASLAALKKNDKVVTSGGIIGVVWSIKEKEDEVTLKIDESSNVRLRVLKSSIARVIGGEEPAKESKEGGA